MEPLLRLIRRLFSKEQRRFIKFCIVGASGVPVNLLCTWVGYHALFSDINESWRKGAAFLFGIVISIFTNFLLNDLWTWGDRDKTQRGFFGRLLRFYLVSSVAAALQFGVAMALSVWLKVGYLLAQLAGIALATMINFVVNNLWTFGASDTVSGEAEVDAEGDAEVTPT